MLSTGWSQVRPAESLGRCRSASEPPRESRTISLVGSIGRDGEIGPASPRSTQQGPRGQKETRRGADARRGLTWHRRSVTLASKLYGIIASSPNAGNLSRSRSLILETVEGKGRALSATRRVNDSKDSSAQEPVARAFGDDQQAGADVGGDGHPEVGESEDGQDQDDGLGRPGPGRCSGGSGPGWIGCGGSARGAGPGRRPDRTMSAVSSAAPLEMPPRTGRKGGRSEYRHTSKDGVRIGSTLIRAYVPPFRAIGSTSIRATPPLSGQSPFSGPTSPFFRCVPPFPGETRATSPLSGLPSRPGFLCRPPSWSS